MKNNLKILIVEDDDSQCKYIEFILKKSNYGYNIAHSVKNAIELIEQQKIFMAYIDLNLPDGQGFEIMEHINKNKLDISVAVTSAVKNPDSIIKSFKLFATDYLIKPISEEKLLSTIEDIKKKKEGKLPLLKKNLLFISNNKFLTPREFEILELVTSAENYKKITEKLFISHNTFKVHLKNIFQKLLLNGRTEVVYNFNCCDIRDHLKQSKIKDSSF